MSFRHSLSHQEMRRPLGHSMSLPVGGVRRKMVEEDSRRVRGRHSVPGANNVNQPSHHPSQPLPQNLKQKLQRSNAAQTGPVRPTRSPNHSYFRAENDTNYCYRTFAFDDGQLSINSSESEVSEHIYEEIRDQSSSEEDEEEENNLENESFMLSISLERRNHLKLYGCLDWDFKPVGH